MFPPPSLRTSPHLPVPTSHLLSSIQTLASISLQAASRRKVEALLQGRRWCVDATSTLAMLVNWSNYRRGAKLVSVSETGGGTYTLVALLNLLKPSKVAKCSFLILIQ